MTMQKMPIMPKKSTPPAPFWAGVWVCAGLWKLGQWMTRLGVLALCLSPAHAISPKDGTVILPVPVTSVAHTMSTLMREGILPAIALVVVVLVVLIVYMGWRFDFSRHPMASDNNRNVFLQTVWLGLTGVFVVFVMTAYLQIAQLKNAQLKNESDTMQMTVIVTATDKGWQYQYQGENVTTQSRGILDRYLKPGQRRLMTTNAPLVLPEKSNIQLLFTSTGGPRKWQIPELGLYATAIAGRQKQAWFYTEEPGLYYGLCNAKCGVHHLTSPIEVRIIPRREFASWLDVSRQSKDWKKPPNTPTNDSKDS